MIMVVPENFVTRSWLCSFGLGRRRTGEVSPRDSFYHFLLFGHLLEIVEPSGFVGVLFLVCRLRLNLLVLLSHSAEDMNHLKFTISLSSTVLLIFL